MKRTALIVLICLTIAGCGKPEPTAQKTNPASPEPAVSIPEAEPIKGTTQPVEFAKSLAELTKMANDHEANFDFKSAAETWRKIDSVVSEEFGEESWQAANARLAGLMATRQSTFDESQSRMLKKLQDSQQEVVRSFQANDLAKATAANKNATELIKQLFGEQSPIYGKQLLQTASLNVRAGNVDEAIGGYHQSLENLKATFRSKHPDIESAHLQLGKLYLAKSKFVPAISNMKIATRLSSELWGEKSIQYANNANELGVAYHQAGQLDIAFRILQASEAIRRNRLGPGHPIVAHSHLNLGIVSMDKKDYMAATQFLTLAIREFESAKKPDLNLISKAKSKLSTVHMLTGQPALAEPLLGQVVQATFEQKGEGHPEVAAAQYRHGVALAKQGKYQLAEPVLRAAFETQKKSLGDDHKSTIQSMKAIALLLKQTRRENESQKYLREIQRVSQTTQTNEFQR